MEFKAPKNTRQYYWTGHALGKMRYYGLTAQRILRVMKHPQRKEEGIAENTVAVMQPASINKKKTWSTEIWVMYQPLNAQFKIISAWRYPGISPKKNSIPQEIMDEVKDLIDNK